MIKRYPVIYLTDIKDHEKLFRAIWTPKRTFCQHMEIERAWQSWRGNTFTLQIVYYPWFHWEGYGLGANSRYEQQYIKMNSIPHFIEYLNSFANK